MASVKTEGQSQVKQDAIWERLQRKEIMLANSRKIASMINGQTKELETDVAKLEEEWNECVREGWDD